MKRKLLLLTAFVVSALTGMRAQNSWTFSEFSTGEFYLYNVSSEMFLNRGNAWNCQATIDNSGCVFTISVDEAKYSLQNSLGYLGNDGYLDKQKNSKEYTAWVITPVDGMENTYTIKYDDTHYLYLKDNTTTILLGDNTNDEKSYWKFVKKNDRENFSSATDATPADVTYLLNNQNFDWAGTAGRGNFWSVGSLGNLNAWHGGLASNYCAEAYNRNFDIYQTINNIPNGIYKFVCQGYYRAGGGGTTNSEQNAYIYANEASAPLLNINSEAKSSGENGYSFQVGSTDTYVPNSMNDASIVFSTGAYSDNEVTVVVKNHKLVVGVKKEKKLDADWTIFDNFKLYYLGGNESGKIVNGDFFNGTNGWSGTAPTIRNGAAEFFNRTYDVYQEIEGLNGVYAVSVQGYYRNGDYVPTAANRSKVDGSEALNAVLYAQAGNDTERTTTLASIFDNEYKSGISAGVSTLFGTIPNDMSQGSDAFIRGLYGENIVIVKVNENEKLKIGLRKNASTANDWTMFDNFELLYLGNNLAEALESEYNRLKYEAGQLLNSETYSNVSGVEKTNLSQALDAAPSTEDEIYQAIASLRNVRNNFVAASYAYDLYMQVKSAIYPELEYASQEKYADVTSLLENKASTAKSAIESAEGIQSKYRLYVESNAMAEGLKYAADKTDLIKDNIFSGVSIQDMSAGNWTYTQTGGNINILNNEPLTDGNGSSAYYYFDYYNNGGNNQNLIQTIPELEAGEYLLTVAARAAVAFNGNFFLKVDEPNVQIEIPAMGNSDQQFGRGWNDVTLKFTQETKGPLTIRVYTQNGKSGWWGATRFRLVKLPETVSMSVKAGKYGTFIAPFDVTLPEDVNAYTVTGMDGSTLEMTQVEGTALTANTAVVLENTTDADVAETFTGAGTATQDTYETGLLTGYYKPVLVKASTDAVSNYIIQTQDGKQAFRKVTADYTTQTPNRAYLTVEGSSNVKAVFFPGQGDATGINAVSTLLGGDVEGIYTVGGAKVNNLQKGVNIIRTADGKTQKVLVK